MTIEFAAWPKVPRLNRNITVTEKIDGTNAAVIIYDEGEDMGFGMPSPVNGAFAVVQSNVDGHIYHVGAQSRKRLIFPGSDNFGFAAWVAQHAQVLVDGLGEGRHFGEWWGSGIQSGYGLPKGHRRFSLFNTARYAGIEIDFGDDNSVLTTVPVLYEGPFDEAAIKAQLLMLEALGSKAAPGFMDPEGVIVFHQAANSMFKVTIKGDEAPKGNRA